MPKIKILEYNNFYFYREMKSFIERAIYTTIIATIFLLSCKKNRTSWVTEQLVPIVDSKLDLKNVFDNDLVETGPNNVLRFNYNSNVLSFKIANDFTIPDTTVSQENKGPGFGLVWDKNNPLVSDTNTNTFQVKYANLTLAKIRSGKIKFTITSTITEPTVITYNMPIAVKNGQSLSVSKVLAAGSPTQPTTLTDEIDLSGYTLDLRGVHKRTFNTIYYFFQVRFQNPTQPTNSYNYTDRDVVTIKNTFEGVQPEYVRGSFTTFKEKPTDDSGTEFDAFQQIKSGTFEFQEAAFNFEFKNYVGADLQGKIHQLTAVNTTENTRLNLTGDLLNKSINISRAIESPAQTAETIRPTKKVIGIDQNNSNINQFISLLPNEVEYDIDFTVNPLGNVSGSNDFLYADKGIETNLNLSIPLIFKAKNLTLIDTADFNLGERDEGFEDIVGGYIRVHTFNTYPFNASIQVYTLDANNQLIDSLLLPNATIAAGIPDNTNKVNKEVHSTLSAPVDPDKIELMYRARKALIQLRFNTDGNDFKTIYASYKTRVKIVGDFKYRMNVK